MRIDPTVLTPVRDLLYGQNDYNGSAFADRLGVKRITFWSHLNRRGMPVEEAEALSEEMLRRAEELMEASRLLRRAASASRPSAAPSTASPASRRARRSRQP